MTRLRLFLLSLFLIPAVDCHATGWTWTPLITSTYFDGITTDLKTAVGGIVLLLFIILGLGILYRVIGR